MYGKLQPLIKKYKDYIGKSNVLTDGQLYFNYLLQKYLSAERFERAAFERRTGVGKNVYYKLSGISKETKDKLVKAETLFDVAIGLRLTYEEALVLFTLWGKNLLCDDSVLQKMNEELLELDSWKQKKTDITKVFEKGVLITEGTRYPQITAGYLILLYFDRVQEFQKNVLLCIMVLKVRTGA